MSLPLQRTGAATLLLVLLIAIPTSAQDLTQGRWTPLVVFPQNLSLYDFDMVDEHVGIAVGASGTVRRTTNGGVDWDLGRIITDDTLRSVAYIERPFVTAVGDHGAIYRSSDDGTTWRRLESPTQARLHAVSAIGEDRLLAAGDEGTLLASADGGATWTGVEAPVTVSLRAIGTSSNGRVVIVGETGTILVSSDRGATWQSVPSGVDGALVDIDQPSDSVWIVTGDPWIALRSTDDGETWQRIILSWPWTSDTRTTVSTTGFFDAAHGFIAMSLNYGSRPYAPYFLTEDGGKTWDPVAPPGVFDTIRTDIGGGVSAFEALGPRGGIALGSSWAMLTGDAGTSWHEVQLGSTSHVRDLSFRDSLNGVLLVADNNGWGIEGGPEYSVMRTSDAGASWRRSTLFVSFERAHTILMRDENVFVTADTGRIHRSTDGGATWKRLQMDTDEPIGDIAFADDLNGLATGHGLFRTTDGGATWSRVGGLPDRYLSSPTPFSASRWTVIAPSNFVGEIGGPLDSARSFTTTDAGARWTVAMMKPMAGSSATFLDSLRGFFVGGERDESFPYDYFYRMTILRTSDGAASWQSVMDSLPPGFRYSFTELRFADDRCGILTAMSRTLVTSDAGATWRPMPPTPARLNTIREFSYPAPWLAFVTDFETLWRYDVEQWSSIEDIDRSMSPVMLAPNPSDGRLAVHFTLERPMNIGLDVIDMLGTIRLRLAPRPMSPGDRQTTIDLGMLPAGAYFVRIHGEGLDRTMPLVRR